MIEYQNCVSFTMSFIYVVYLCSHKWWIVDFFRFEQKKSMRKEGVKIPSQDDQTKLFSLMWIRLNCYTDEYAFGHQQNLLLLLWIYFKSMFKTDLRKHLPFIWIFLWWLVMCLEPYCVILWNLSSSYIFSVTNKVLNCIFLCVLITFVTSLPLFLLGENNSALQLYNLTIVQTHVTH